jgi:hypothetical protein
MDKPKTVREILEYLYAKGLDLSDTATVEEINVDCKEQVDLAEAALNAIYSPLSVEEIEKLFSENFSLQEMADLGCEGMYIPYKKYKELIHALYPHLPRLNEAQIDEVLPKKKENEAETAIEDFACYIYMGDNSVIKGNRQMAEIYNQAISDCRQALLKLREVEQNGE